MPAPRMDSLTLFRAAIAKFCQLDVPPEMMVPEAELADLDIDSLSLAEMLFAMEDALGTSIIDMRRRPQTVGDVMRLVEPHLDTLVAKLDLS